MADHFVSLRMKGLTSGGNSANHSPNCLWCYVSGQGGMTVAWHALMIQGKDVAPACKSLYLTVRPTVPSAFRKAKCGYCICGDNRENQNVAYENVYKMSETPRSLQAKSKAVLNLGLCHFLMCACLCEGIWQCPDRWCSHDCSE